MKSNKVHRCTYCLVIKQRKKGEPRRTILHTIFEYVTDVLYNYFTHHIFEFVTDAQFYTLYIWLCDTRKILTVIELFCAMKLSTTCMTSRATSSSLRSPFTWWNTVHMWWHHNYMYTGRKQRMQPSTWIHNNNSCNIQKSATYIAHLQVNILSKKVIVTCTIKQIYG